MRNLSYENEFCVQFHFHANQSHFHKNGFALRLALKQRGTRELANGLLFSFSYLIFASDNFCFPGLFFATVLSIVKDSTRLH